MKNILRLTLIGISMIAAPALAQVVTLPVVNTATGLKTNSGASVIISSDGTEKGTTGNPVVTSCPTCSGGSGPSSSQLPATLGAKTGALSLSVVPNTDTAFPVSAANLPLPAGAATSALQTTINTTLGTPFQAGGSIGNTTFAATQATASSLNAQVVGPGAHGAAVTGNPNLIAGYASNTAPTAVTTGQAARLWVGLNGELTVSLGARNAASAATSPSAIFGYDASGNSAPLFTAGMAYDGTNVIPLRSITGAVADGTGIGVTAVEQAGALFSNITTGTTTTVKSGKGILHKIVLNTYVAAATITIYDNTAASGTKIGTLTLPATITGDTPITLPYDLQFSTGLTLVTSGATDITVIYR